MFMLETKRYSLLITLVARCDVTSVSANAYKAQATHTTQTFQATAMANRTIEVHCQALHTIVIAPIKHTGRGRYEISHFRILQI